MAVVTVRGKRADHGALLAADFPAARLHGPRRLSAHPQHPDVLRSRGGSGLFLRRQIRAPFAGRISASQVFQGEMPTSQAILVKL
jgi:hypothetical protein